MEEMEATLSRKSRVNVLNVVFMCSSGVKRFCRCTDNGDVTVTGGGGWGRAHLNVFENRKHPRGSDL